MSFSPPGLLASIEKHLPAAATGSLCVAFSGGLDSTVLLHALAAIVRDQAGWRLRAVHIDHQLHEHSAAWERQCAEVASTLGVEYESHRVNVALDAGEGVESSARSVRYQALRDSLQPGEALLTAHHADDQLETMLLALLRGAGVNGLAAMPAAQVFGAGWHLRPLLAFTRDDLEQWAKAQRLAWIGDPSNDNDRFSRNYLRREVLPALRRRWPGVAHSAVRSAGHLAETGALLDTLAETDLATAALGPCLRVDALAALTPERRRNLLRYWARVHGARPPSTRKLLALDHDMLMAQADRLPVVEWDGFVVRRHRGLLYADRQALDTPPPADEYEWEWSRPLPLPGDLGLLRTEIAPGGLARSKLSTRVRVSFRHGGESLRPAGHEHHRKLKKLLQDADILPWWRQRLPLIYQGEHLAAVGDLWIAEEFAARGEEAGLRVVWEGRPQIGAVTQ